MFAPTTVRAPSPVNRSGVEQLLRNPRLQALAERLRHPLALVNADTFVPVAAGIDLADRFLALGKRRFGKASMITRFAPGCWSGAGGVPQVRRESLDRSRRCVRSLRCLTTGSLGPSAAGKFCASI